MEKNNDSPSVISLRDQQTGLDLDPSEADSQWLYSSAVV